MKIVSGRKVYIWSFIIPVIVMIAVFAILGIWPFGNNTIMTGDTTYQLVDYLSYYKTIIFGNNDFSYSLSKNMGGEMAGFAAYYLFSPLNLLTLPFSRENLFLGIGLIIVLVPGLASLSMCYVLRQLKKNDNSVLIFSFCYGLSAYIIVYNELIYYYTNIILLPVIVLYLREMAENSKPLEVKYIILLAFAVINNYYTGYMICIFLIIYFTYYLFSGQKPKNRMMIFLKFAMNSILAVLLSCFTLIPAVMSLSGEKDNLSVGFFASFSPFRYFSKLYSGSFAGDFGAGIPNIYCGVIISLLLGYILINYKENLRKRIFIGGMLLFFWVDFFINTLNVTWHGFNQPIGFPYRQSFVVIFFCIITAFEETDLESVKINRTAISVMIISFILYSVYIVIRKIDNTDTVSVAVTSGILAALIIVLILPLKKRLLLLALITLTDLSFNAFYSLSHFYLTSVDEYRKPLSLVYEASRTVKGMGEDDLYRIEKSFRRTNNDAMMCDYAGLTHFSSSEKKETIRYMGKLGFRDNGNWAMYSSTNTPLADSILGIRYFMSEYNSTGKPYEKKYADEDEEYYIYKNPYALPVMSATGKDVFDVELKDNPFENQNRISDSLNGEKNNILFLQEAERIDNPDGSVSFDVEIQNDGILYGFFTAPEVQDAVLYNDGDEWSDYFSIYNWSVVDLEERNKGEKAHIDIKPGPEKELKVDNGYFAIMDSENLEKWNRKVTADETSLYKRSSSYYEGNYDSEKSTLLFSIPMDKGWHLYVDGCEYILKEACGHMMAAYVPSGKHDVILKFVPPGRRTGVVMSGIGVIALLIFSGLYRYLPLHFVKKTKKNKSLKKLKKSLDFA